MPQERFLNNKIQTAVTKRGVLSRQSQRRQGPPDENSSSTGKVASNPVYAPSPLVRSVFLLPEPLLMCTCSFVHDSGSWLFLSFVGNDIRMAVFSIPSRNQAIWRRDGECRYLLLGCCVSYLTRVADSPGSLAHPSYSSPVPAVKLTSTTLPHHHSAGFRN